MNQQTVVSDTAPITCRLCGGRSIPAFTVGDLNRGLSPCRFEYRRCVRCQLVFIAAIPDDLTRYYAPDGYGPTGAPPTPELRRRERAKLEMLARFVRPGRMVEIGPGPGLFTQEAQAAGFQVTAIEMDERYCEHLDALPGVHAICSQTPAEVLPTLARSRAIVMWHAIEHLPDPWQILQSCSESLEPSGVLAISTPNPDSLQFRLLGSRWVHVDAPRHLQLIPFAALQQTLGELGMSCVLLTTADPVGRALSLGGWEVALRRGPARALSTRTAMRIAFVLAASLRAVESRGMMGAAYTALFVREPADPDGSPRGDGGPR